MHTQSWSTLHYYDATGCFENETHDMKSSYHISIPALTAAYTHTHPHPCSLKPHHKGTHTSNQPHTHTHTLCDETRDGSYGAFL